MADGSSERFVLLNRLADEFAARYRRGERPPLQEYIDRHPELADEIREFFPTLVAMEQVKDDRQAPVEQPATHTLLSPERLGDFRIIREIGHGGMGVVYEAEQVSLGRHVALKVLPSQALADAKQKRRFEREAKAAAKLHHTNIVPVFGVGEHDGLPYYVMQFIQGLGLDLVLEELNHMRPGAARTPTGLPTAGEIRVSRRSVAADVARSLLTGVFQQSADADEEAAASPRAKSANPGVPRPPPWMSPRQAVRRFRPQRRPRPMRQDSPNRSPSHPRRSAFRAAAPRRAPKAALSNRPTGKASPTSAGRWPTRWLMRTSRVSCIATSSRRTCCWTCVARSG
jgi:Protein kinase domain